jgi:hypothetical protein
MFSSRSFPLPTSVAGSIPTAPNPWNASSPRKQFARVRPFKDIGQWDLYWHTRTPFTA